MAIRNPDGSVYQTSGSLQQYNPCNSEFDLLNLWDSEAIRQGGSPLYYYEVMIQANTLDKVLMEDRGKLWSPTPIEFWGIYDPVPSQNFMTTFGIDSPEEIMFEVNYRDFLDLVGSPPKVGSRIFSPHRKENWIIIQRGGEQFQLWGQFRLQIMCKKWQDGLTLQGGNVSENIPSTESPINYNSIRPSL